SNTRSFRGAPKARARNPAPQGLSPELDSGLARCRERPGMTAGNGGGKSIVMRELIPDGKLRVGVAFAPSPSPLFVVKDKDGSPRGVTVDLGNELAQQLGVPVEFMVAPNTGEL